MSREIPLRDRKGKVIANAMVDDEDYKRVHEYNWCLHRSGYAVRVSETRDRIKTTMGDFIVLRKQFMVYLQRFILNMDMTDKYVAHHVNENKLDCRRTNLQRVSRWANAIGNLPHQNFPSSLRREPVGPNEELVSDEEIPLRITIRDSYNLSGEN